MKAFLDTGFLLTLLLKTSSSNAAWELTRKLNIPLALTRLQVFNLENRLQREMEAEDSNEAQQAVAAGALQNFRWYLEQQVFELVHLDYEIAFNLAYEWQKRCRPTPPALLLLWPALAVVCGATHFLSFDPRTRQLVVSAGLKLVPKEL